MDVQPNRDHQDRWDEDALWDEPPAWEHDLDVLARSAFVMAPPPDVQRSILAAVLQAAAEVHQPAVAVAPLPAPAPAERPISLTSYLLLAGVIVAYFAALSWVQGMVGGGNWLQTMAAQLLAVTNALVGPLPVSEPMTLLWLVLQRAPWLALLPLAWLLWERDRASAPQAA